MWELTADSFISGFVYPRLLWNDVLLSLTLGTLFSAIWFIPYWTSLLRTRLAWGVLAFSAFFTWFAVWFIQTPLQYWTGLALNHFFSQRVLTDWILLAGIPQILLSGIVQEAAKLVPVIFAWTRKGRNITPREGLLMGAVAGLGFGLFEVVYFINRILIVIPDWEYVSAGSYIAFLERLLALGFHISVSALAGWGLAKGKGWRFYLLASFLHGLLNYGIIVRNAADLSVVQTEIYIAAITLPLAGLVLWLRWKKADEDGDVSLETSED